ncbi:hypothetical protein ABZ613_40200 [Streptomyces collinus]|uniref:hypothetical protein n=1 Tax=Streptomyces collinus TaxID=42684 RepID=UPI0033E851AE
MTLRLRRPGALITALATAAAVLGLATPANAAIHRCSISGDMTNCTTVTGIDPGSWLQMRTGPGYGYANVPHGTLLNGDEVGLICWTTGDGAADNPNYRYWMLIDLGVRSGYVNDWYLNTGNPSVWQQQIRHC